MPDPTPNSISRRVWLGRLAEVLALPILLAAGVGTLLGFTPRASWPVELFCHFRVQYFWALAIAVSLLLLRRRWKLAVLAGSLTAANLAVILPLYFAPTLQARPGRPVRAMLCNVHWDNRRQVPLLDLLHKHEPDVVLLVEITERWAAAMASLRDEYPHSQVLPSPYRSGMGLYSKYEIVDVRVHHVEEFHLPTIVAKLKLPDGTLTLVGAHPSSPGVAVEMGNRNRQLSAIAELAGAERSPVLLLGDLNTTSWSPIFRELLAVSRLRDSRCGFGVQPSWPWFVTPLRIPIDHGLVSTELTVLDRWIGQDVGSDHRPVFIDFAMPLDD